MGMHNGPLKDKETGAPLLLQLDHQLLVPIRRAYVFVEIYLNHGRDSLLRVRK